MYKKIQPKTFVYIINLIGQCCETIFIFLMYNDFTDPFPIKKKSDYLWVLLKYGLFNLLLNGLKYYPLIIKMEKIY